MSQRLLFYISMTVLVIAFIACFILFWQVEVFR
jgi:hypothetical protein